MRYMTQSIFLKNNVVMIRLFLALSNRTIDTLSACAMKEIFAASSFQKNSPFGEE